MVFHEVPGNLEALYLQLVLLRGLAVPGVTVAILGDTANHLITSVTLGPDLALSSQHKTFLLQGGCSRDL